MFAFAMNANAEEKLLDGVVIRRVQVDDITIKHFRECAVFDVCVDNIDRAFFAFLASEGFNTLRESLQARITAIGQPLGALYSNALIAADVDAHELNVRSLASDSTVVLAYRVKVYSQRAAKDLRDVLLMHYEENDFASRFIIKYWRAADVSFSPSTVRVPLFRPPR